MFLDSSVNGLNVSVFCRSRISAFFENMRQSCDSPRSIFILIDCFFCDMPRVRLIKGVFLTRLARNIVAHTTLPCFNMGLLSSCNSQCFCSTFVIITISAVKPRPPAPDDRIFLLFCIKLLS